jgi:hypothetical protein
VRARGAKQNEAAAFGASPSKICGLVEPKLYHIRGAPAPFIGIVYDAPDEQSAIEKTVEEYGLPENQRGRLIAQRD